MALSPLNNSGSIRAWSSRTNSAAFCIKSSLFKGFSFVQYLNLANAVPQSLLEYFSATGTFNNFVPYLTSISAIVAGSEPVGKTNLSVPFFL